LGLSDNLVPVRSHGYGLKEFYCSCDYTSLVAVLKYYINTFVLTEQQFKERYCINHYVPQCMYVRLSEIKFSMNDYCNNIACGRCI
jgi:hypothetical protein